VEVLCLGFTTCYSTLAFRLAKHLQWWMSLQTYPYANIHMLKQICSFSISRFHTCTSNPCWTSALVTSLYNCVY